MKSIIRSSLWTVTVGLALTLGARAHAETPREELAHAYRLIERADADYKGHRLVALKEVEGAGKDLGLELKGDLPGEERQWKSDRHLEEARRLLRHAREKLEWRGHEHAAEHVDVAIKELDTALKIK